MRKKSIFVKKTPTFCSKCVIIKDNDNDSKVSAFYDLNNIVPMQNE